VVAGRKYLLGYFANTFSGWQQAGGCIRYTAGKRWLAGSTEFALVNGNLKAPEI